MMPRCHTQGLVLSPRRPGTRTPIALLSLDRREDRLELYEHPVWQQQEHAAVVGSPKPA